MSYGEHIWKNLKVAGYCLVLFFVSFFHGFYPFKRGHRLIYFLEEKVTGIKRGIE